MRLHAIGNQPCPWCKARKLAYQYEHANGGDLYRCLACDRSVVHEPLGPDLFTGPCELTALHSDGRLAATMECPAMTSARSLCGQGGPELIDDEGQIYHRTRVFCLDAALSALKLCDAEINKLELDKTGYMALLGQRDREIDALKAELARLQAASCAFCGEPGLTWSCDKSGAAS